MHHQALFCALCFFAPCAFTSPVVRRPSRPRSSEIMLKRNLLKDYDSTSRPVLNDSEAVQVQIGISLFHLMNVNEKQQTIQGTYSFRFSWTDQFLSWNASEYGIDSIFIPYKAIWHPDVFIYNTAMGKLLEFVKTNVIVSSSGQMLWMVPFTPVTTCDMNVLYYPFDIQSCKITFMSWAYAGRELNLSKHPAEDAVYHSRINQEWEVLYIDAERNDQLYACCPDDPYPDLTFTVHMRRHSLFYIVHLLLPTIIIFGMSIVGFLLPRKQRIDMETTVWLTLVVFLDIVIETMPPRPDSWPVLSQLFLLVLSLVGVAVAMAAILTNLGDRPHFSPVPLWGVKLIKLVFKEAHENAAIRTLMASRRLQCHRDSHDAKPKKSHKKADNSPAHSCDFEEDPAEANGTSVPSTDSATAAKLHEWELFAEALDRVFYYAYLVLSLALFVLFAALIGPAMHKSFKMSPS